MDSNNEGDENILEKLKRGKGEFEIQLDWLVNLSLSTTQDLIAHSISPPNTLWFSKAYTEGPNFEGIIEGNRFKVWTKALRRGTAPAILKGELTAVGKHTKVSANIFVVPYLRIFSLSPNVLGLIGFVTVGSFISLMLEITRVVIFDPWLSLSIEVIFPISLLFLLANFSCYIGTQEVIELKGLMDTLFSKYIA